MKKFYYFLGATGTLLLGSVPIYFVGQPTILFPLPVYLVFSSLGGFHILTCFFVFFTSSLLVFNKTPKTFKKRAYFINSLLTIGSIAWLFVARKHGIQYQGLNHYIAVLVLNAVTLILLWWLTLKTTSKKSYTYSFVLPFFLVWLAFPYLGELP